MDNLLKQLQQLFITPEKWNYFGLSNLSNPFDAPENDNSKQFIREFLEYSNKTKDIYDVLELIEPYRNLHVVTDYFLGIFIYENNRKVKMSIDNQIKKSIPSENISFDNSFKYFWFLICFYHDVGYYYENNSNLINSLSTIEKDLGITDSLHKLLGVPKVYHNVKNKYLKYRLVECNVYDHGIIGGMLFYDRLLKIYKYYKKMHGQNSFTHNGLFWSDSMIKYFQLIASIVFTHNIWFKNTDTDSNVNIYSHYGLDKLIISNSSRKVSLERHPLLFLLGLVDSIEPTKRFGINFLNKVRLIFSNKDTLIIAINYDYDNEIDKWFESINTLNSWLKVETNIVKESHLEFVM